MSEETKKIICIGQWRDVKHFVCGVFYCKTNTILFFDSLNLKSSSSLRVFCNIIQCLYHTTQEPKCVQIITPVQRTSACGVASLMPLTICLDNDELPIDFHWNEEYNTKNLFDIAIGSDEKKHVRLYKWSAIADDVRPTKSAGERTKQPKIKRQQAENPDKKKQRHTHADERGIKSHAQKSKQLGASDHMKKEVFVSNSSHHEQKTGLRRTTRIRKEKRY